jgi:hypothetical protein
MSERKKKQNRRKRINKNYYTNSTKCTCSQFAYIIIIIIIIIITYYYHVLSRIITHYYYYYYYYYYHHLLYISAISGPSWRRNQILACVITRKCNSCIYTYIFNKIKSSIYTIRILIKTCRIQNSIVVIRTHIWF